MVCFHSPRMLSLVMQVRDGAKGAVATEDGALGGPSASDPHLGSKLSSVTSWQLCEAE
jgi:hypothetical protein